MGGKIPCGDNKEVLKFTTSDSDIRQTYNFEKILGKGSFGLVRVISLKRDPEKRFALKIIDKKRIIDHFKMFENEISILRSMDHPNIINFYETYQDSKYYYTVMEYCSGGELMDKLIEKNFFPEIEVQKIMAKLFSAIKYIHEKKIVHSDLKLENIIFSDKTLNAEPKIIDFGLSTKVNRYSLSNVINNNGKVGSLLYMAPEVFNGNSSYARDIWSLGVIMYILLSGNPPFYDSSHKILIEKIQKGVFDIISPPWDKISSKSKDLLTRLLKTKKSERLNIKNAINHDWFKKDLNIKNDSLITFNDQIPLKTSDFEILKTLNTKKYTSKLKKEVLKVLINRLSQEEIFNLKETFNKIDTEKTGTISSQELMNAMKSCGINKSEEAIKNIIVNISGQSNINATDLKIKYSDFLAATLDVKLYYNEHKLWNIFKYFDVSNDDHITTDDLKEIMKRNGNNFTDDEISNMIKENNTAKNGKISFREFCDMLDLNVDKIKENL